MFWTFKWLRWTEWFWRRPKVILLLLPFILGITFYSISGGSSDLENIEYDYKSYRNISDQLVDGYLVWNSKCHMLSKDPVDSSIARYIKKENYEPCAKSPRLTYISREQDGNMVLVINPKVAQQYKDLSCCWSNILRPSTKAPVDKNIDSKIITGPCQNFIEKIILPKDVDVVLVKCSNKKTNSKESSKVKSKSSSSKQSLQSVYENVHAILNPDKVQDKLNNQTDNATGSTNRPRKLSILALGIDNVSRLNYRRSLPKTAKYLQDKGFITMNGYNKMGENTFPNLMAILTGQSLEDSYGKCTPKELYGLDNCPMIWYKFRDNGYVTAYGEDSVRISTFNFLKAGFVDPPTDYYLRTYMMASEKVLKVRRRFHSQYCTGPELSIERIFDYGIKFAKTFLGHPYFGFFWSNTVSHDDINGVSTMDNRLLSKFHDLENSGVLNDSMIIFLSDHGMRWGEMRNTFLGWYEERLPFLHIWLPEWFREEDPEAYTALEINQNRLVSPFDLHMTLRDILMRAGGQHNASSACPTCLSLFQPVPYERGCEDVGVSPHWCTCTAFVPRTTTDEIAKACINTFSDHVENIIKNYVNEGGKRLCAKLKVKKLHRVDQVVDITNSNASAAEYFFMIEVEPGGGKYEATMRHYGPGNFSLVDEDISRINSYSKFAKCLTNGLKQYCYCTNLLH